MKHLVPLCEKCFTSSQRISSIIIKYSNKSETAYILKITCMCKYRRGFIIKEPTEPKVIRVEEGSDVILPCSLSSRQDITPETFEWKKDGQKQVFQYNGGIHSNSIPTGQDQQFRGRVSHFSDKLKSGDASITISNTKVTDSGNYTCEFPDIQPSQMFHMKLRCW
ncbi:butyrophilin-like protein 1 isoform X10 [Scomber scombrus]|uniref:Butyrophilin-like protein 1 isoform X10 n=1 Tax=Scomber scombrus TaxID=13677 RepID=A0AAV1QFC7_SCOSC